MKPIHIFKTGKHIDSHGTEINFSDADLAGAVACYDPTLHEAPIVIGHPEMDARAYGWVKNLSGRGSHLYATPKQVNPEFSEQVQAGAYKKVSASFYPPESPNNPVKGKYYLRHVGFLGAQPPAIKGLAPVEFGESDKYDDALTLEIEFAETTSEHQKGLKQAMKSLWTLMFGESEPLPNPEIERKAEQNPDKPNSTKPTAEPDPKPSTDKDDDMTAPTQAELDAKQAEIDKLTIQIAEREKADAKAKADAQVKANAEFAESLVEDGKLAPKNKELISAILDGLDTADSVKPVEFGEGDDKKSLKQAVKDRLANANTDSFAYLFSEAAGKPKHDAKDSYDFGEQADPDSVSADTEVRAYMQANNVSYAVAAKAVLG